MKSTVAAVLMASGFAAQAVAGTQPAPGHYLTSVEILSLTPVAPATLAECKGTLGSAGQFYTGITLLTRAGATGKLVTEFRSFVFPKGPSQQIENQVLTQGANSTFAKQTGIVTEYFDGVQVPLPITYKATASVLDAQSFVETVTATVPNVVGASVKGACVQVLSTASAYTGS